MIIRSEERQYQTEQLTKKDKGDKGKRGESKKFCRYFEA